MLNSIVANDAWFGQGRNFFNGPGFDGIPNGHVLLLPFSRPGVDVTYVM